MTDTRGASDEVFVGVEIAPHNVPLYIDAGPDRNALSGQTVNLSVSANLPLVSHAWTQTAGPTVQLSGADTANASFVVPEVTQAQVATFEVRAESNTRWSTTDTVNITLTPDGLISEITDMDAGVQACVTAHADTNGWTRLSEVTVLFCYNEFSDILTLQGMEQLTALQSFRLGL